MLRLVLRSDRRRPGRPRGEGRNPKRERGRWRYGCARGGRIYDLASLLVAGGPWGPGLRDRAFATVRTVVRERA